MAAPIKISSYVPGVLAVIFAAFACLIVANSAVTRIEQAAQGDVTRELWEFLERHLDLDVAVLVLDLLDHVPRPGGRRPAAL